MPGTPSRLFAPDEVVTVPDELVTMPGDPVSEELVSWDRGFATLRFAGFAASGAHPAEWHGGLPPGCSHAGASGAVAVVHVES